jgi:hypothetical protein
MFLYIIRLPLEIRLVKGKETQETLPGAFACKLRQVLTLVTIQKSYLVLSGVPLGNKREETSDPFHFATLGTDLNKRRKPLSLSSLSPSSLPARGVLLLFRWFASTIGKGLKLILEAHFRTKNQPVKCVGLVSISSPQRYSSIQVRGTLSNSNFWYSWLF